MCKKRETKRRQGLKKRKPATRKRVIITYRLADMIKVHNLCRKRGIKKVTILFINRKA